MKTYTINPLTHKVVPIEMTEDMKMASDINSVYSAEEQYKFIIDVAPEYPADAGWISAADRLPVSKEMIICAREKNDGEWALDINYWTVSNRWAKEYTHWMPLPPAPESK